MEFSNTVSAKTVSKPRLLLMQYDFVIFDLFVISYSLNVVSFEIILKVFMATEENVLERIMSRV